MTSRRHAIAVASLAAAALIGFAPPSGAEPIAGGDARITPQEGGSSTPFSVDLPDGASCPGDSADDGYRVNSYMVPAEVDPADVTYGGEGPTPGAFGDYSTFREPLFDLETNWYVSIQTADAEQPGAPGLIVNVPQFSFGVYEPGGVPAGRYNVGIVCTLHNEITTIWPNEIEVTEEPDDAPAGIRWRVIGSSGTPSDPSSGSIGAPPIAAAVVVAIVGAFVFLRRRRPQPIATSPEDR